ncbi:hypothetical protein QR680_004669 [Steinernema hermaphroditum]|uniref:Pellino n=1 Tax=Steinernema hermaphroditum TaxID=289476 RepID=A0AA39HPF1_9BILA|nr:hypothetical protein QR680_004669 [Steinernema hermaphroditum]
MWKVIDKPAAAMDDPLANRENGHYVPTTICDVDERPLYGELILLGYNGVAEGQRPSGQMNRKHRSKMTLLRKDYPNGIKKFAVSSIAAPPRQSQAVQDPSKHVVSYTYEKGHTVLVEYVPDDTKDMFQIGRSSEDQIDFTIVDTWLAAGSNMVVSPAGNNMRLLRAANSFERGEQHQRPISSTISRYACRILIDRDEPTKAYVFAAGFDGSKNIFLGEKATKWIKKNGEADGLTTNGILILHPNRNDVDDEASSSFSADRKMYVWREVSVDGDIYSLRETRSSTKRGELITHETHQLQDGTLIDLCGATLLWRSADGLAKSPSKAELEHRLDELNAGKPQCPVNLNTLIIPRKKSAKTCSSSRQPYVYLGCGHVQGKHDWGVVKTSNGDPASSTAFKCPICLVESSKIIQLIMGMESAFHLDSESLDYCFNPCGHMASLSTVRYWSRIPLPHGTNSFHPVCPFCTSLLCLDKPFVRLIFQDHCFDS